MQRLAPVLLLAVLACPAPALASRPAAETGRLLVTLAPSGGSRAHASAARALAARAGVRLAGPTVPQIGLVTVRPPAGESLRAAIAALRRDPAVAHVEREGRMTLRFAPNDPALTAGEPSFPSLPLQWTAQKLRLPLAWDHARGAGAVVAVIDTGIDGANPDLRDKIAGQVDLDEDPSGPPTTDENGHGTHVSSLACAAADNGYGIVGTGYDCKLLVIKSDLTDSSVAAAITTAADQGADVVSMSFGDDGAQAPAPIADALHYAYRKGVVLIAAAADQPVEEQGSPANVLQPTGTGSDLNAGIGLTVTAANYDDARAGYAGRGSQISLAAYGSFSDNGPPNGIFAAFPANQTELERRTIVPPSSPCDCRTTFNGDSRYAYLAGTSMAVPEVAGIAALVAAVNPQLGPADVLRILKQTARRPAAAWNAETGWGIVDAAAAVAMARRTDRTAPESSVRGPRTATAGRVSVRVRATDPQPGALVASGVRKVTIYGSRGHGYHRLASGTGRRIRVRLSRGTWRLYSRAADRAGNREHAPRKPDVRVSVG